MNFISFVFVSMLVALTQATESSLRQEVAVATGTGRCGNDWTHANNNCPGTSCSLNTDCYNGQSCFGGLNDCAGSTTARCGVDWASANGNCGATGCGSNADCPSGQNCYVDLAFCKFRARCGSSWSDANYNCNAHCKTDADCGGLKCYTGIEPCQKSSCGRDAMDALNKCGLHYRCDDDSDCEHLNYWTVALFPSLIVHHCHFNMPYPC